MGQHSGVHCIYGRKLAVVLNCFFFCFFFDSFRLPEHEGWLDVYTGIVSFCVTTRVKKVHGKAWRIVYIMALVHTKHILSRFCDSSLSLSFNLCLTHSLSHVHPSRLLLLLLVVCTARAEPPWVIDNNDASEPHKSACKISYFTFGWLLFNRFPSHNSFYLYLQFFFTTATLSS